MGSVFEYVCLFVFSFSMTFFQSDMSFVVDANGSQLNLHRPHERTRSTPTGLAPFPQKRRDAHQQAAFPARHAGAIASGCVSGFVSPPRREAAAAAARLKSHLLL